jgi:hypothetical protein
VAVNDVVGAQSDVFSTVVTSDQNIFAERSLSYGGDPIKGGSFAEATVSGAPAGLTSVVFPYLDMTAADGSAITQTVYLYNPGGSAITVRGIFAASSTTVVKTYSVAANSITAVSVNTDAAALKGSLGGIFQIVPSGAGSSDAFVALAVTNSASFKTVTANQGTYPIAAATGF